MDPLHRHEKDARHTRPDGPQGARNRAGTDPSRPDRLRESDNRHDNINKFKSNSHSAGSILIVSSQDNIRRHRPMQPASKRTWRMRLEDEKLLVAGACLTMLGG